MLKWTLRQIGAIVGSLLFVGGLFAWASVTVLAQDGGDSGVGAMTLNNDRKPNYPYNCDDLDNRAQVEAVFEIEGNDI